MLGGGRGAAGAKGFMADNAISRQSGLQSLIDSALLDPRVDAMVVAIGTVALICERARHNPHPAGCSEGSPVQTVSDAHPAIPGI